MYDEGTLLDDVREYTEEYPVFLRLNEDDRWVVSATNEGGHNGTSIDLLDLLTWVKTNRPELLVLA